MTRVCLVACTSRKGDYPAAAEFIYRSPLFSGGRNFAETRCDQWFILSAKYGLLSPRDQIEPYNETLIDLDEKSRIVWAKNVFKKLHGIIDPGSEIIFLAGTTYRANLEPLLLKHGHRTASPMSFLGIGSQVAWLQKVARNSRRIADLDRLYFLFDRISKIGITHRNLLNAHTAKTVTPERGVYFFFEEGEKRMTAPFQDRVTRVGTHSVSSGSKSTLWNRLRTHRGAENGIGNHRGSIFRLHVGESIIRRADLQDCFQNWGRGQSASADVRRSEDEIELEVSDTIGKMPILWLEVADEASADSDRTYLERNIIALLSGSEGPIDLPSDKWLGRWSSREAERWSGLWNVNHVYEDYDSRALDIMEIYVEIAEGSRAPSRQSMAPAGWRHHLYKKTNSGLQIDLI